MSGVRIFQLTGIGFSRSLTLQDYFLGASAQHDGVECGIFYCHNLNLDSRHKLTAWNRLQTNNFYLSHSRFALLSNLNNTPGETERPRDNFNLRLRELLHNSITLKADHSCILGIGLEPACG